MPIRLTDSTICRLNNLLCAGLITSCLIATPCAAWEFDLTPDTTQYLADPSFIPMAGQIFSDSGYNHFWVNATSQFSNFSSSSRTDTDQFTQEFWYGITDRLSFNASDSFQMTNGSRQFTNPRLVLDYRAVAQTESPVSVDIEAIYYPPAVTTIEAGGLTFHVSREMKSLTLQLEANATYYGTGPELANYWTYLARLRSQWRFIDYWGLNSGLVYSGRTNGSFSTSSSDEFVQSNSHFSSTYHDTVTPYIGLSYEFWPTHATVSVEYQHSFLGDINQSSEYSYVYSGGGSYTGSSSSGLVNRNEDFFALDIIFLF